MKSLKKEKFIKNENGSVTLFVLIAMIFFLIVCFFIYTNSNNRKSSQILELEQVKKNYESTSDELESEYSDIIGDDVTNVDLTTLVTGDDVNHTHIYEKKSDNNYHWEECFICGNVQDKQEHHKETTGTGSCRTYLIEYCTDGCGYSKSTYVDHEIEYYPEGELGNTNASEYTHGIGYCKKCGEIYISTDGVSLTRERCVDENGNLINCVNRKKCVKCGYDYAKTGSNYHPFISARSDGKSYYCANCNTDLYKVYYFDTIQDENNNLHWTIRGFYQLLGKTEWAIKTDLPTWSPLLSSNAFEKLESANVTDLPKEYYNNPTYGTEGITSGLYLVQFEAYIKNGYQGTPPVSLNSTQGLAVNGNLNDFARPNRPLLGLTISPDTKAPIIDNIQIDKSEVINGFSKKASITVDCSDSYSDIVYIGLYDTEGNAVVEYGTAVSNGDKTFTRTFDIVSETRDSQTLILKAKDRYGNESTKNIEIQNLDAKAPTLINDEDYTAEWSKNKRIELKALDLGVGDVQIAFNNIDDYQLAEKNENIYTRIYNFYGDIYDKVTAAIYLKDALGNEQMVKLDIGKLDNTAPTITKTEIVENVVKIEANDRHKILGEGSGVKGYRYLSGEDDLDKKIVAGDGTFINSNEIDITNIKDKYLYIAPVDNVGNIGKTVKVTLYP